MVSTVLPVARIPHVCGVESWRLGCKTHFAKDRRYPLDYEDFVYATELVETAVARINPDIRAEIEQTSPVVWGKKIAFVEDEVDALVGLLSNVPF